MTRQFISHVEELWEVITEVTFVKNRVTEVRISSNLLAGTDTVKSLTSPFLFI
jgi:hypothetical protein